MVLDALLEELHELSRPEKLRVMQFLIDDLATEDVIALGQADDVETWRPVDAGQTADALEALLRADEQSTTR